MPNITAVLKKRKLRTNWGFHFNTDIQEYVENAMLAMHYGYKDYYLCFTPDAPKGVYSNIDIEFNEELKSFKFLLT